MRTGATIVAISAPVDRPFPYELPVVSGACGGEVEEALLVDLAVSGACGGEVEEALLVDLAVSEVCGGWVEEAILVDSAVSETCDE